MARSKSNLLAEAVCHVCKEPISATAYVRSRSWAFGIAGARWACCSAACANKVDDS